MACLARPWKEEHRFAIFVLASRQFRAVQDRHIELHLTGRMRVHPHLNLTGCVSDHLAVYTSHQQPSQPEFVSTIQHGRLREGQL